MRMSKQQRKRRRRRRRRRKMRGTRKKSNRTWRRRKRRRRSFIIGIIKVCTQRTFVFSARESDSFTSPETDMQVFPEENHHFLWKRTFVMVTKK